MAFGSRGLRQRTSRANPVKARRHEASWNLAARCDVRRQGSFAMTADEISKTIREAYGCYETGDRERHETLIARDFTFTSPYDDAIDRTTYFERCWPNHKEMKTIGIETIFAEGEAAFVTYFVLMKSGRAFRNTEFVTLRDGRIASAHVYFGEEYRHGTFAAAKPPAG
jgi:ketosteroid isomerase-like protein